MNATAYQPATSPLSSLTQLVMNGIGEYTASSVSSDPLDASALRLVRQLDGSYAPRATPRVEASDSAAARAGASMLVALQGLALGG